EAGERRPRYGVRQRASTALVCTFGERLWHSAVPSAGAVPIIGLAPRCAPGRSPVNRAAQRSLGWDVRAFGVLSLAVRGRRARSAGARRADGGGGRAPALGSA